MSAENFAKIVQDALDSGGVRNFKASEVLFLGQSHYSGPVRNEICPPYRLGNLIEVAKQAQILRDAFGFPLRVLSAYRAPAYNRSVGGEQGSFHLQAKALDLAPVNSDEIGHLIRVTRELHKRKVLKGGRGIYSSFVHIDVGPWRSW